MNGIMNMIKFGKVGIAMLFLYFLGIFVGMLLPIQTSINSRLHVPHSMHQRFRLQSEQFVYLSLISLSILIFLRHHSSQINR